MERLHGEWLAWTCCDATDVCLVHALATDVTDVCLPGTLAKSSVYMGNGRMPHVFGTWISGVVCAYSHRSRIISIESKSFPSAAMPCQIARHTGDWLLVL